MDKSINTPGADPTVVDTIKQIEQDMGSAMVAGDVDKLSQIYGDDFVAVETSGKVITKETLLTDFKSFMTDSSGLKLDPWMCRYSETLPLSKAA